MLSTNSYFCFFQIVNRHGPEADRHLLRCLFSHVDFSGDGKSSGKDFHQVFGAFWIYVHLELMNYILGIVCAANNIYRQHPGMILAEWPKGIWTLPLFLAFLSVPGSRPLQLPTQFRLRELGFRPASRKQKCGGILLNK